MDASASSLQMMDAVYHGAQRFITGCKPLTHCCTIWLIDHHYPYIYFSIGVISFRNPSSACCLHMCLPTCHIDRAVIAFAHSPLLSAVFRQCVQDLEKRHYPILPLWLGTCYNRIWRCLFGPIEEFETYLKENRKRVIGNLFPFLILSCAFI